jgi:hypothetical protein
MPALRSFLSRFRKVHFEVVPYSQVEDVYQEGTTDAPRGRCSFLPLTC